MCELTQVTVYCACLTYRSSRLCGDRATLLPRCTKFKPRFRITRNPQARCMRSTYSILISYCLSMLRPPPQDQNQHVAVSISLAKVPCAYGACSVIRTHHDSAQLISMTQSCVASRCPSVAASVDGPLGVCDTNCDGIERNTTIRRAHARRPRKRIATAVLGDACDAAWSCVGNMG